MREDLLAFVFEEETHRFLGDLSQIETLIVPDVPRGNQEYTAAWAILHALEHTALHTGQIQLARQLWEQGQ